MLKGNKGEWSELFVFFKLLAEKKIFSADENLEKTSSFVEIKSISRRDSGNELNYELNGNVNVIDSLTGLVQFSFSIAKAKEIANNLLNAIKSNKIDKEKFTKELEPFYISKVADKSIGKGDINIHIYDPRNGVSSKQQFSIKSFLGSKPTLFNANATTNIIYKISKTNGDPISDADINLINTTSGRHKYISRIKTILDLGHNIEYHSYQDRIFNLNLQMIDSDLPKILAIIVLDKYINREIYFSKIISKLNQTNPIKYDLSEGHKFYEYRLVNFLVEAALGMTSKTTWSGEYDVVGGILIVKQDSEILCYHLIDFNKFRTYLKNASKLDNPSGSKMGYGKVYKEGGDTFIKLNFQIKA